MGGLGHVIGGALQGIGQGMAMQVKDNLETKRATALEKLRAENDSARLVQQANLQDRNASRQTDRETNKTIIVNRNQAETQAQRDARLQGYEQSNIRLRGAIDSAQASNNAAANAAAAQVEREWKSGQVTDIKAGADGFYYKITAAGVEVKTNIPVAPKDLVGGGGLGGEGVLGQVRGGAPAAAPKPAATPEPKRPPANRPPLDSFNK